MIKADSTKGTFKARGSYWDVCGDFGLICQSMARIADEIKGKYEARDSVIILQNAIRAAMFEDETGLLMKMIKLKKVEEEEESEHGEREIQEERS